MVKTKTIKPWWVKNVPRPIASELFIILSLLQDSVNMLQKKSNSKSKIQKSLSCHYRLWNAWSLNFLFHCCNSIVTGEEYSHQVSQSTCEHDNLVLHLRNLNFTNFTKPSKNLSCLQINGRGMVVTSSWGQKNTKNIMHQDCNLGILVYNLTFLSHFWKMEFLFQNLFYYNKGEKKKELV